MFNYTFMNTADRIRNKIRNEFPKGEFLKELEKVISKSGRITFICDSHISSTNINEWILHLRDRETAIEIAKEEGFKYYTDTNSYGVKYLIFTL